MTESEQRHFEVLLEQVLHEVKTVAEGHGALDEKMERFHKEAKEDHHLVMDLLKYSYDKLNNKIDGVRIELKEEIQGAREALKDTREELSAEIQAVGRKVDGHEERICFLERKVA